MFSIPHLFGKILVKTIFYTQYSLTMTRDYVYKIALGDINPKEKTIFYH